MMFIATLLILCIVAVLSIVSAIVLSLFIVAVVSTIYEMKSGGGGFKEIK